MLPLDASHPVTGTHPYLPYLGRHFYDIKQANRRRISASRVRDTTGYPAAAGYIYIYPGIRIYAYPSLPPSLVFSHPLGVPAARRGTRSRGGCLQTLITSASSLSRPPPLFLCLFIPPQLKYRHVPLTSYSRTSSTDTRQSSLRPASSSVPPSEVLPPSRKEPSPSSRGGAKIHGNVFSGCPGERGM